MCIFPVILVHSISAAASEMPRAILGALSFSLIPAQVNAGERAQAVRFSLRPHPEMRPSTAILRRWVSRHQPENGESAADPREGGVIS